MPLQACSVMFVSTGDSCSSHPLHRWGREALRAEAICLTSRLDGGSMYWTPGWSDPRAQVNPVLHGGTSTSAQSVPRRIQLPSKTFSVCRSPLNQSLPTSVTVLVSLKEQGLRTRGQEAYSAGNPRKREQGQRARPEVREVRVHCHLSQYTCEHQGLLSQEH